MPGASSATGGGTRVQDLGDMAPIATFGATAVLAIITFFYWRAVQRQVHAQTSPCVILYASIDQSRLSIIQLVVKNIGTAMAYGVQFKFSAPVPHRAFGLDMAKAKTVEPMSRGPLIDGIPTLAPGETRRIDWGQIAGLTKNLGKPIEAICSFTDGKADMPPTRAVLEVDSYLMTVAVESELARIDHKLEKIARVVERYDPWRPIRVQVVPTSPEDPEEEDS